MISLEAVFSLDSVANPYKVLDELVSLALFKGGVWASPRASDGVISYRTTECGPTRVRLRGKLLRIEQTLHSFWLDVERDPVSPERLNWTLYFDVDETKLTPRRARTVLDAIDEPGQIAWLVTLTGRQ